MTEAISDERLCWLAVRDQLEQQASRLTAGRPLAPSLTFGPGPARFLPNVQRRVAAQGR